jgi:hypothetical protein
LIIITDIKQKHIINQASLREKEPPELFENQQEVSERLAQVKKEASRVITDNSTFESYKIILQSRSTQVKIKLREEAVYSDLVELFECKLRLKASSKDHLFAFC